MMNDSASDRMSALGVGGRRLKTWPCILNAFKNGTSGWLPCLVLSIIRQALALLSLISHNLYHTQKT